MMQDSRLQTIDIIDFPILKLLTGFDSPSKQAECLRNHKIYYIQGKDGKIVTTTKWLEQAPFSTSFSANDEINLNF
jgi:hypothetical protein